MIILDCTKNAGKTFAVLSVLVFLVFLAACSSPTTTVTQESSDPESSDPESFDPVTLEINALDQDLILTPVAASTTLTITVSGFAEDAASAGLVISPVAGLTFSGYTAADGSMSGIAPDRIKTFSVNVTYDSTTQLPGGRAWISIGLDGLQPDYNYNSRSVEVIVFDGKHITSDNISAFNAFANTPEGLVGDYVLTEDVILATPADGESNWSAIGSGTIVTPETHFRGSFDGGGFSVRNLTIRRADDNIGFIAIMGEGGKIENLTLEDPVIENLQQDYYAYHTGSFVGYAAGNVTITNCHVVNGIIKGDYSALGGIAGYFWGTISGSTVKADITADGSTRTARWLGGIVGNAGGRNVLITDCEFDGNITGLNMLGGIAGEISNSSSLPGSSSAITNSRFTGTISGQSNIGGIAGRLENAAISNSFASEVILTGSSDHSFGRIGGIAGYSLDGTISGCEFSGTVGGRDNLGGIAGRAERTGISKSSASGVVRSIPDYWDNIGSRAGGIVGDALNVSITDCVFTGSVSSQEFTGGIVGYLDGEIDRSIAVGTVESNRNSAGGITGRNGGTVSNSVALTSSINGSGEAGRITGVEGGTLSNNYAWSGMLVRGSLIPGTPVAGSISGANIAEWDPEWFKSIGFNDSWWIGRLPTGP